MIGRADIEGSKSNGASTKDWLPMTSIELIKKTPGWGGGLTKYPRKVDVSLGLGLAESSSRHAIAANLEK